MSLPDDRTLTREEAAETMRRDLDDFSDWWKRARYLKGLLASPHPGDREAALAALAGYPRGDGPLDHTSPSRVTDIRRGRS